MSGGCDTSVSPTGASGAKGLALNVELLDPSFLRITLLGTGVGVGFFFFGSACRFFPPGKKAPSLLGATCSLGLVGRELDVDPSEEWGGVRRVGDNSDLGNGVSHLNPTVGRYNF